MKIIFTEDKVTLGDLALMESGRTISQTIRFLCKFVVDQDGAPVSEREAVQYVQSLSMPEGRAMMAEFWKFIGAVRADAVNPPNGAP